MINKRGQDLSIGTLILIVLGIVLLVLLILGFSIGWQDLWEKINIFGGGTSLDSVIQKCNLAVTSNSLASYCESFVEVKVDGKKRYINCEYSKIAPSLEKTLSCSANDRVKNKCEELVKGKLGGTYKADESAKFNVECKKLTFEVNDVACTTYCDSFANAEGFVKFAKST